LRSFPRPTRATPGNTEFALEAKSKKGGTGKVGASTIDIAGVIRHRTLEECNHAIVVGRDFPAKEESALTEHIADDRQLNCRAI
jgi:hypothetical protein